MGRLLHPVFRVISHELYSHKRYFKLMKHNSIQDYLYSAFYDTIVAQQLYRKLSFLNFSF